jgi:hypothetical protein
LSPWYTSLDYRGAAAQSYAPAARPDTTKVAVWVDDTQDYDTKTRRSEPNKASYMLL